MMQRLRVLWWRTEAVCSLLCMRSMDKTQERHPAATEDLQKELTERGDHVGAGLSMGLGLVSVWS